MKCSRSIAEIAISAAGEHEERRKRPRVRVPGADRREQHAREQLDERVADRDRLAAVPAVTAQDQPRHDRDVVAVGDLRVARRAVRTRLHDRLVPRHAPDHDVEERSDHEPVHARDHCDEQRHERSSVGRAHHCHWTMRVSHRCCIRQRANSSHQVEAQLASPAAGAPLALHDAPEPLRVLHADAARCSRRRTGRNTFPNATDPPSRCTTRSTGFTDTGSVPARCDPAATNMSDRLGGREPGQAWLPCSPRDRCRRPSRQ